MQRWMTICAAAIVLSASVSAGEAANVRRHLNCTLLPPIGVGGLFGGPQVPQQMLIRNTWSLSIPKGTLYTYRINRSSKSFKSAAALASGGTMQLRIYAGGATSCDVSVPG
jgi:hypothetical protein